MSLALRRIVWPDGSQSGPALSASGDQPVVKRFGNIVLLNRPLDRRSFVRCIDVGHMLRRRRGQADDVPGDIGGRRGGFFDIPRRASVRLSGLVLCGLTRRRHAADIGYTALSRYGTATF